MRLWRAVAALVVALALTGCATGGQTSGLTVTTSFYPMYEFTRAVVGSQGTVVNLVPNGTEPHDWEPSAKDLKTLSQSKLFVYNGAGMEQWVGKALSSLGKQAPVSLETAKGINLMKAGAEEGGSADAPDPHVWLDPVSAIAQVSAIRDAIEQVDPANRATYEANASAYIAKLQQLDSDFKAGLSTCPSRDFFTSHAAFGYLARRYGLNQVAIMGLTPDAEPTPKALAEVVARARKDHIAYIFFETLVSDKVAQVVAREVGAKTMVLNPLEGLTEQELKDGKDYLAVMRQNLANLRVALSCQ